MALTAVLWTLVTGGCFSTEEIEDGQATDIATPELTYRIVERVDASFGKTVQFLIDVSLSREATEDELRDIAVEIIKQEAWKAPVNAIGMYFYLPDTNTNGPYTAGKAEWAPDGDIRQAHSVTTGDYSRHELLVDAGPLVPGLPAESFSGPPDGVYTNWGVRS